MNIKHKADVAPDQSGQHTHGPWFIDGDAIWGGYGPGSNGVKRVAIPVAFASQSQDAEYEANARLIAAAPELLEIVKEIEREYDCMNRRLPSEVEMHNRIKTAIAKAQGNTQ